MDCIAQPDGSFMPHEGGSPYNVARAIALQGGHVTFAAPLSTDDLGSKLGSLLVKDGVKLGMATNTLPTSLAMVSLSEGQASYQFYRDGVADRAFSANQALAFLDSCPAVGILHTGSLALVPSEASKTLVIVKAAKASGWIISCDINLRPRLASNIDEYRAIILEFMAVSDWLKASDEDLITLLGSPAGAILGLRTTDIYFANAAAIAKAMESFTGTWEIVNVQPNGAAKDARRLVFIKDGTLPPRRRTGRSYGLARSRLTRPQIRKCGIIDRTMPGRRARTCSEFTP